MRTTKRTTIQPPARLSPLRTTAAGVLAAAALAGVAQATAQAPEPLQDQESVASPAKAEKSRKRILHLRGGTTMRGVTRRAGDDWEIKEKGGWRTLPGSLVERTAVEKEVRAQLKELQKAAPQDDLAAEARTAGWALESGLLEEGLRMLDAVLEKSPDQPQARAAIGENAQRFAVPRVDPETREVAAVTDEMVRWAAKRSASSHELAVLELARVRDRAQLEEKLTQDLFGQTPRRRSFAALAMRRIFPGHGTKPLLHRAILDGSDDVRRGAALALKASGQVGVIVPAVNALDSSHPKVRSQAAEALGNMGYPAAVEPLMARLAAVQNAPHRVPHSYIFTGRQFAYIQDFDVEVAQFQAVADPQINVLIEGQTLEAGVHGVKDVHYATEARAIRGSLAQLTGADPGRTSKAWLDWWDENGSQWATSKMADVPPK